MKMSWPISRRRLTQPDSNTSWPTCSARSSPHVCVRYAVLRPDPSADMSGCYLAVAMAAVSALELARKVGDLGQLLRPSFEVAQLYFARDELITDHNGKMSAVARRPFQLARQSPCRQIGGRPHPRRGQPRPPP